MAYFIKVPIFFIIYVVITTAIASYFMAILAAKTGLAYLGRFATFVMIPAMVIFNCSPITLVLLATFVEIAGGVAVDVLSGRKIISLAEFNNTNFFAAQWFGLVIASITSAVVLWLLTNSLVLGSSDLVAYKAHTRALLIEIKQFEYIPMMFGLIVGTIASWFRINTGMLLGGILMPFETAIGLIIGAVFSFLVKDNANAYPISAGIFAANSLYMIFKAILG